MRKFKIAYVYDNVYPYCVGGVEKRIWELGRRLAWRGHEVHHFCMKYWEGEDIICRDGIRLHGICPSQKLFFNDRRSIREAMYFAWKVLGPLAQEKYDIVDCQNAPYFPVISSKLSILIRQSRIIVTWHEVWDKYWYEYLGQIGIFGLVVERLVAMLSNRAIAVSPATKSSLIHIGVKPDRIALIPNGIDLNNIESIKPSGDICDIIYTGRLIKEKGVHILIEALSIVREKRFDVRCIIIGEGPEKEKLLRMVTDLNLQNNVYFKDFLKRHDELIAQVKKANLFVLPSMREGFGLVVIEANACGIPVITTNHPRNAAKDLIIEGKNGYVCSPVAYDLAQIILIGLANKSFTCKDRIKKYDWEDIVDSLLDAYNLA